MADTELYDGKEKGQVVGETYGHSPAGSRELAHHDVEVGGNKMLKRNLKGRHMQMIAIGGSIGAGLFIGTGGAFATGGPGSVLIDFIIIGIMLLFTVNALGELAVMYPVNGSFYDYSVRFIDPAWGFAMGWNYAMSWLVVLPFELTAASITIGYWTKRCTDPTDSDTCYYTINPAVWVTIFLVLVVVINVFGVKGYGEVEFALGLMKVCAIIGFCIFAIITNCGGIPTDNRGYIGVQYWHEPYQAFKNGFHGFCSVFVTASFAFGGTELVALAAAEADNPRKTLPKATKQVFWRITLFYVLSLFLVGLIVPSNDELLANASTSNVAGSPFVRAITLAGVQGLPSVFNAVIMLSVISVANSCTYGSTRTIQALCAKGMGPKWGAYIDKKGRPYVALIVALLLGALAYINASPKGGTIFNWLLAISGLANFFTWGSACLAHIMFRRAWAAQGRSTDELPFKAQFGVVGSYIGLGLNILCLIAGFYIALYPVGDPSGYLDPTTFFQSYLAVPVVLFFFMGYKLYQILVLKDYSWGVNIHTMDLDAGRRELNLKEEMDEERRLWALQPWWKKALHTFG